MERVVVVLRPARFGAGHEVPAVEVEDQRPVARALRELPEVRHDAEHPEPAVLLDERHRVGVRGQQHLLVSRRAVVLSRQIRNDRLARVALEARAQRQRGRLPALRIGEHLRAVDAIERQRRTVDVRRAESGTAGPGVDAALREAERHSRRQVVHDDDAGGVSLDSDLGEAVQLAPLPPSSVRRGLGDRRRHEQLRPLAGRAPLVVGERVVVEEVVVVGRRRLLRRLEHENFAGDLRLRGRMRRVVVEHLRRDAVGRRRSRRHAVRRDDRHRRSVGDELLDRVRRVVHVRPPVRPVLDDVVVVGDVDVVEIDRAELGQLRNQEVGVALPADAAGVGRAALGFEEVPVERLLRRHHERLVDLRERGRGRFAGRRALGPERVAHQHRACRHAGCRLQEGAPRQM